MQIPTFNTLRNEPRSSSYKALRHLAGNQSIKSIYLYNTSQKINKAYTTTNN